MIEIQNHPDPFVQEITLDVWKGKYRWQQEAHPNHSFFRVCDGVYAKDTNSRARQEAYDLMCAGLLNPAGRIHAGAGTDKVVTWVNCFVMNDMDDSMRGDNGIGQTLYHSMLTLQQGGGIGVNFSTLRPAKAVIRRTGAGSRASGPLPFMDMWNAMCQTMMSAGARRGAMMAVMAIDHPDIIDFIHAKREKGRLTNFNVSVLVTDKFWEAKEKDDWWRLGFHVPPDRESNPDDIKTTKDGKPWYVYKVIKARELWDMIVENTYEWSEPGVIFIDRINQQNNLLYTEQINCTNPCGEQPLPPWGACNLGSVNLARMVDHPFSQNAKFNWAYLSRAVSAGVRFLDNVIDTTGYPLTQQQVEQIAKRRIGLGPSGLANALAMLAQDYRSPSARRTAEALAKHIAVIAFETSVNLAKERGPFPNYDPKMLEAPFFQRLQEYCPHTIMENAKKYGLRNGTLLTIAPVGTTSVYYGNTSSGLEPVFALLGTRKVLQPDNTHKEYEVVDYGWRTWLEGRDHGEKSPPELMVEAKDLSIADHIEMQASWQPYIDTSISKTINVAPGTSLEEFRKVYDMAWDYGLKGCTTYRPSDVRGSVLSGPDEPSEPPEVEVVSEAIALMTLPTNVPTRPDVLDGKTYKVRWPTLGTPMYVTISDRDGKPFEMFISSKSARYMEWITGLTLMVSAMLRMGAEASFVAEELKKVISPSDSAWLGGKFYGSLVARIGAVLQEHVGIIEPILELEPEDNEEPEEKFLGEICPECNSPAFVYQEGCANCQLCGFSNCE